MIADHDRSYYFGASDTDKVIGNWKTKTWEKWWMQKMGINNDHFDNEFTKAGTNWEHRILDSLHLPNLEKDKQIIIEDLRLRVNLDGNTPFRIKEVKTYQWEKGWKKTPPEYINQVQVQMFASNIYEADIVAYGLEPEDYKNYLRELDPRRLKEIPVAYDPNWIETVYLPKLRILADCLKRGVSPMSNAQKELARVIERYFGADAAYLDIDCFTLAKRIIEAGWTKKDGDSNG